MLRVILSTNLDMPACSSPVLKRRVRFAEANRNRRIRRPHPPGISTTGRSPLATYRDGATYPMPAALPLSNSMQRRSLRLLAIRYLRTLQYPVSYQPTPRRRRSQTPLIPMPPHLFFPERSAVVETLFAATPPRPSTPEGRGCAALGWMLRRRKQEKGKGPGDLPLVYPWPG
ncbi:hypothetical protein LY76DRAFT_271563 [Colletotrichum caudatum]|nr:hypothetical protein LY76DRAFT_271563 [Colletotrichum caudatum]